MADHRALAIENADTASALLRDALRAEPDRPQAPSVLIAAAQVHTALAGVHLQLVQPEEKAEDKPKAWPHPVGTR